MFFLCVYISRQKCSPSSNLLPLTLDSWLSCLMERKCRRCRQVEALLSLKLSRTNNCLKWQLLFSCALSLIGEDGVQFDNLFLVQNIMRTIFSEAFLFLREMNEIEALNVIFPRLVSRDAIF